MNFTTGTGGGDPVFADYQSVCLMNIDITVGTIGRRHDGDAGVDISVLCSTDSRFRRQDGGSRRSQVGSLGIQVVRDRSADRVTRTCFHANGAAGAGQDGQGDIAGGGVVDAAVQGGGDRGVGHGDGAVISRQGNGTGGAGSNVRSGALLDTVAGDEHVAAGRGERGVEYRRAASDGENDVAPAVGSNRALHGQLTGGHLDADVSVSSQGLDAAAGDDQAVGLLDIDMAAGGVRHLQGADGGVQIAVTGAADAGFGNECDRTGGDDVAVFRTQVVGDGAGDRIPRSRDHVNSTAGAGQYGYGHTCGSAVVDRSRSGDGRGAVEHGDGAVGSRHGHGAAAVGVDVGALVLLYADTRNRNAAAVGDDGRVQFNCRPGDRDRIATRVQSSIQSDGGIHRHGDRTGHIHGTVEGNAGGSVLDGELIQQRHCCV